MISTVKHKKNAMTEIRGKATKIYLTDKNKWPFPFLCLCAVQLLSASEIKMYSISVALNMAKECLGVSFAVRLMFPDKYCTINNIKPIVESNGTVKNETWTACDTNWKQNGLTTWEKLAVITYGLETRKIYWKLNTLRWRSKSMLSQLKIALQNLTIYNLYIRVSHKNITVIKFVPMAFSPRIVKRSKVFACVIRAVKGHTDAISILRKIILLILQSILKILKSKDKLKTSVVVLCQKNFVKAVILLSIHNDMRATCPTSCCGLFTKLKTRTWLPSGGRKEKSFSLSICPLKF